MYHQIKNFLFVHQGLRFETLGQTSFFNTIVIENDIVIISSTGGEYRINETLFSQVQDRYEYLAAERPELVHVTTEFGDNWNECPNNRSCPYIAAIIRDFKVFF